MTAAVLPVTPARELARDAPTAPAFLIEALWGAQAVGIVGGEPKCGKSFLALHLAVAVASGTPCLGRFAVPAAGPVLVYPAEDSAAIVRARLDSISRNAGTSLDAIDLGVITAPSLRLDGEADRDRLARTVAQHGPALLVLDPFVRLHRIDENACSEVAPLLAFLRQLQRTHGLAILVVHHARKGGRGMRPGQALRGSSEFHAWGDSNLYLRRRTGGRIRLEVEHRGAPSIDGLALELVADETGGAHLALGADGGASEPHVDPAARVLDALATLDRPASRAELREQCRMKTATLSRTLAALVDAARIHRFADGRYQLPA